MQTDQILGKLRLSEVDFELNWGKTVFLEFSQKEAEFGKTNYSPFSFSLGPIYEQNMSEIDFSTSVTVRWIFVGNRS